MEEKKALFPALDAEDIEVKLNPGTMESGFEVVLYKSGTIDAIMLDRVFGPMGWQKKNETILRPDGTEKLTCTISVWDETHGEWVSKDGVGTGTDWEAEKGQETDAMKRAGFQWGIGRELKYHMPKLFFPYNGCENIFEYGEDAQQRQLYVTRDKFVVEQVVYDDEESISRRIAAISIRNITNSTRVLFDIREQLQKQKERKMKDCDPASEQTEGSAPPATGKKEKQVKQGKRGDNAAAPKLNKPDTPDAPDAPTLPAESEGSVQEEPQVEGQMDLEEVMKENNNFSPAPPVENPIVEEEPKSSFSYDGEPEKCPVPVAKWRGTDTVLGDLKAKEVRFVYLKADTPADVKKCCKALAKKNDELRSEFIKNGIPV